MSSKSPLSAHLAPGDVIVSLDGMPIRDAQEWREIIAIRDEQALRYSNASDDYKRFMGINGRKGYCVPVHLIDESKQIHLVDNQSACLNELTPFVRAFCFDSSILNGSSSVDDQYERKESRHCLNTKDIIKLKKCGDGWVTIRPIGNNCKCSEVDFECSKT